MPTTVLPFVEGAQPKLPPKRPTGEPWPSRTREWWRMWGRSPLTMHFTEADWSELLDTATVHARLWTGDGNAAGELRQRTAKFGATPEDRARLRIQFAQADEADHRRPAPAPIEMFADLKAVDDDATETRRAG